MNQQEQNEAGREISEYFKTQGAAHNDKASLPVPPELSDPKCPPEKREAADAAYTEALLARNAATLTKAEQGFLHRKIMNALRDPYGS